MNDEIPTLTLFEDFLVRVGSIAFVWAISLFSVTIVLALLVLNVHLTNVLPSFVGITFVVILFGLVVSYVRETIRDLVAAMGKLTRILTVVNNDSFLVPDSHSLPIFAWYLLFGVLSLGIYGGQHTYASRTASMFGVPPTIADPATPPASLAVLLLDISSSIGFTAGVAFVLAFDLRAFEIARSVIWQRTDVPPLLNKEVNDIGCVLRRFVPRSLRSYGADLERDDLLADFVLRVGYLSLAIGAFIGVTAVVLRVHGPDVALYDALRFGTKAVAPRSFARAIVAVATLTLLFGTEFGRRLLHRVTYAVGFGIGIVGLPVYYLLNWTVDGRLPTLTTFRRILNRIRIRVHTGGCRLSQSLLLRDTTPILGVTVTAVPTLLGVGYYVGGTVWIGTLVDSYPPPAFATGTLGYTDVQLTLLEATKTAGAVAVLSFMIPFYQQSRRWYRSSSIAAAKRALVSTVGRLRRAAGTIHRAVFGIGDDEPASRWVTWIRVTLFAQLFILAFGMHDYSFGVSLRPYLALGVAATVAQSVAVRGDLRDRSWPDSTPSGLWPMATVAVPLVAGAAYLYRHR